MSKGNVVVVFVLLVNVAYAKDVLCSSQDMDFLVGKTTFLNDSSIKQNENVENKPIINNSFGLLSMFGVDGFSGEKNNYHFLGKENLEKTYKLSLLSFLDFNGLFQDKNQYTSFLTQHITKVPSDLGIPSDTSPSLKEIYKKGVCSQQIVSDFEKSEARLQNLSRQLDVNYQYLIRLYLADNKKFSTLSEGVENADGIALSYKESLKEILDKCYLPAENSNFVKKSYLLDKIGQIVLGDFTLCTGLEIGENQTALTARHCFFRGRIPLDEKELLNIWYKPARNNDRYQVCGIIEPLALNNSSLESVANDQVLIRIAKGGGVKVDVMDEKSLVSTSDEKYGEDETRLTQVSYIPLATEIDPFRYRSGFFTDISASCAAISKDKGCFSHFCRAVSGGSGSPLFLSNATNLILVGTHVGSFSGSQDTTDCKKMYGKNIAAYPRLSLINQIKGY